MRLRRSGQLQSVAARQEQRLLPLPLDQALPAQHRRKAGQAAVLAQRGPPAGLRRREALRAVPRQDRRRGQLRPLLPQEESEGARGQRAEGRAVQRLRLQRADFGNADQPAGGRQGLLDLLRGRQGGLPGGPRRESEGLRVLPRDQEQGRGEQLQGSVGGAQHQEQSAALPAQPLLRH